jgi:diguanylate cyclase (GGDEF)-like protein
VDPFVNGKNCMISIKKHIDKSVNDHELLAELEASYCNALESIEESFLPVTADLATENRREVRRLRKQLEETVGAKLVVEVRGRLRDLLRSYSQQGSEILEQRNAEVKRILRVFAEAVSTLTDRSAANDGRLHGFTRNLESIIEINDLPEIRKRLVHEVSELKQAVANMSQSNWQSIACLQSQLESFQEKLAQTERIAETDVLTQVKNRRAGERLVGALIRDSKAFSILLLDLNHFKAVNDRWGHQAGDSMLVQFAGELKAAVRESDMVCRWGGDEFLVLLPGCSIAQAAERGKRLVPAGGTEYRLRVPDGQIGVRLSASVGCAEHRTGETVEQLFRRADESLYQAKGRDLAVS